MTSLIDTLGKAARHNMLVVVRCLGCGREAKFMAHELAVFYGHGRVLDTLPFKCLECGVSEKKIRPMEFMNDRTREIIVWRPTKMKI
ncbi:hypothetical protein ACQQ2Q_00530 [Agrobacterium sp. ES01]|uniref:hypothetical protein n=1 Tax=Agrobacterium sp. ES01 TaxID=3420714 RepID=UPI003D0990DB